MREIKDSQASHRK